MAHSIRAVQKYLELNGNGRHWITIKIAPTNRYLRRRAIAVISPDETDIIVANDIGFEQQRLAIAHELAHLLIVKLGPPASQAAAEAKEASVSFKEVVESACGIFEKDLCKRHHIFYSTEANRNRLLFHSLSAYPAPKD